MPKSRNLNEKSVCTCILRILILFRIEPSSEVLFDSAVDLYVNLQQGVGFIHRHKSSSGRVALGVPQQGTAEQQKQKPRQLKIMDKNNAQNKCWVKRVNSS